jgi:polysaccharide chain length determinant protein (PEP-CTERM system associated)
MEEVSEEQIAAPPDFERYLGIIRRRHIQFLIPLLAGWIIVWGASWVLPPKYKSTTLILVEQPTMPKNYVEPNVSDNLQDRLQSITEQILSRTRLLLIVNKLHLFSGGKRQMTSDAEVARMRKDIDIELVRNATQEITSFTISYTARDPHVAQAVTSELTALFINENLKTRQQQSKDTTTFIEGQLEDARQSLSEQEAKVREFQSAHEGELPTQQASNLQILSGLQSQLQNEQDALNTARQQRVYDQAVLDQSHNSHAVVGPSGVVLDASPTAAIDQQITALKARLAELHSQFTDRYPDVQAAEAQLASAEQQRNRIIADARKTSDGSKRSGKDADGNVGADSVQNLPLLQLQGQFQANEVEIKNREHSVADLKARISDYQARLNLQPSTEQQLADLTRGYDQSKANYDDLLKKKNESAMATDMEQMQQGERFTTLDPPSLPLKPDFPNRLKFCGLGFAVGLALGVFLVGGLEYADDRLFSEKEIKALLPVTVISEIPQIEDPSEERGAKKRLALGWTMAALTFGTILAGAAYSFLRG